MVICYNAKVLYMAALAPVAYMGHTTSPLRYMAPYAQSFEVINNFCVSVFQYDYNNRIADFFGNGEFLPRNAFINYIFRYSCEAFRFEERICENYLFLICGHDPEQFDENLLPMILGHVPAGASTKTLVHYAQEIKSNHFQQYDYGAERNIILYNSTTPPLYNLSKVSVPVSLHYGDNDLLARPMVSISVAGTVESCRGSHYGSERDIILYNSTTPPLYNLSKVSVPVSLHYGDNDLLARPMHNSTAVNLSKVSVPVSLHYGDNDLLARPMVSISVAGTVESCRGSHYGSERDIILYNSTTPPLYNLSKVSVPVSLHYGDNDLLARPMVSILVEGRGVFVYTTGLRGILFCTIAQLHRCTTCPRSQFLYRCTMEITTCWRDPCTTPPLYNLSKVSVPVSLHYGDNDLLARPMVSISVAGTVESCRGSHYGSERDIILYNSTTPPLYNLSKVSVPVSLHYGDNDLLARPMVSVPVSLHYGDNDLLARPMVSISVAGTVESCRGSHYGPERDIILYKSTTPPLYNLSKVSVPVSLHYGDNDLLARPMVSISVAGTVESCRGSDYGSERDILYSSTTPSLHYLSKVVFPVSLHYGDRNKDAR
ncbi:hypothetical protein J6590_092470 [Homalodisca vitripennis]|nr:hypothetical protein J6590_092470 [Homalodisca vitripennis]